MSAKRLLFLVTFCFAFTLSVSAQISEFKATFVKAQQNNQEVAVTLSDGNTFSGFVVSVDEESAGVKTKDGVFNFQYDRIKEVRIVDPTDKTSRWYQNPASNKLFLTQSGRMLKKGSGYYQNTYIFISSFTYAIFQNLSLNAGFSTLPGLGIENQFYTLGAKLGVDVSSSFSVSGTFRHYQFPDFGESANTMYGAVTFTKNELDITGGVGIGLSNESNSDPIFILGGQLRVSERIALLSENLIYPDGSGEVYPLGSFGIRILSPKGAIDLGFFAGEDIGAFIPFASFAIKF